MQDALNDAWRPRMWRRIFMLQLTKASAVDSAGELETQECKCFRSRLRPNTEQSEPNASRGLEGRKFRELGRAPKLS